MTTLQSLFRAIPIVLISGMIAGSLTHSAQADRFVVAEAGGGQREITGRLYATARGAIAIEKPDGQMELFAQGALLERDTSVEWKANTPEEVAAQLEERFTPDLFRSVTQGNYVVGMVFMAPIERRAEGAATGFLRKAVTFMNNVERIFETFTRSVRLETTDPEVPLVLLIFESDDDFNEYAVAATKGQGLSANRISGFYDGITNFLAIRMAECATFEVPLHEAIHQQVYNRGILQRLAPVPAWFNEGIATGFEANRDRIRSGPNKIHSRYALRVQDITQLQWETLVSDDAAFRGDVLAGDAYCLAWCLHWLLVTEYPEKYQEYVETLSKKEPLHESKPEERLQEFVSFFGNDFRGLEREFSQALKIAARRQRFREEKKTPGLYVNQQNLAEIELRATALLDRGGVLELQGRLKNMNPLRDLTFAVTVVTDGGTYAQWVLPNVGSEKILPLPTKYATQPVPGANGQPSSTFRVYIDAALPESSEARQWTQGSPPSPVRN